MMSINTQARIGAILFILWGLLHVAGGGLILSTLTQGPEAGFAIYQNAAGPYPPLAGQILGYLAYTFLWLGVMVAAIGVLANWRNSQSGLALNTALCGLTDIGLIIFLVLPGHVSWAEASLGLILLIGAAIFGGLACNTKPTLAQS